MPLPPQGTVLRGLPDQQLLFYAEARDPNGIVLLKGCTNERARKGLGIEVELECVCQPEPGVCAALPEQPGNNIDDDCDGLTDECTSDLDCNDNNGCTQDLCIVDECHYGNWPDGTSCDDGNRCTHDNACDNGVCAGVLKNCDAFDFGLCWEAECNQDTGQCEPRPLENGTVCDDGLYCSLGDACQDGACTGQVRDCADDNDCTMDTCDEDNDNCGHVLQPRPGTEGPPANISCTDGEDNDCDGLTDDQDPNCKVCSQDSDCEDDNECTTDNCVDDECVNSPVGNNTQCSDDGVYCNGVERCLAGVCTSPGNPCSGPDADSDCEESCDETAKNCTAPDPENDACDDGNWCTLGDACAAGECKGQERDCDDGDDCTQDRCDDDSEDCLHELLPNPGAEGPMDHSTCGNGVDDDCDGLTDAEDSDCSDYCASYTCWSVPPTGQTACYNNETYIAGGCPGTPGGAACAATFFCGQDAQYQDNVRTFDVQNVGENLVVVDSLSGLIWQQDFEETQKTWQGAKDYCTDLNYAGADDWRLPDYHDLSTLVDYGKSSPAIDVAAFPNMSNDYFWSSSPYADDETQAWIFDFGTGSSHNGSEGSDYSACCVRAGTDFIDGDGRFVTSGSTEEEIVTDLATGLVWQKEDETGDDWQAALSHCESIDYANQTDWRLPNIKELGSLVNTDCYRPTSKFPNIDSSFYLSSSSSDSEKDRVWFVNFLHGGTNNIGKFQTTGRVRCVRGGP